MKKNQIIQKLEEIIGTDKIGFISGDIENPGTENCKLQTCRGSVYGIAIRLEGDEITSFYDSIPIKHKNNTKINHWISIGDKYYPLYWGKDINLGSRPYAHTKSMKSTGTLQLNDINELKGKKLIFGAMPCINYELHEKEIREQFPDILKTTKGNEDQLSITDLSPDENH